jgi:hypothetical protein
MTKLLLAKNKIIKFPEIYMALNGHQYIEIKISYKIVILGGQKGHRHP